MKLAQIIGIIEEVAPASWQEEYDNSGLIIGDPEKDISKTLVCVDVTAQVIDEAFQKQCELIISHHPLIFKGIKSLSYKNNIDHLIIQAIKKDIAIYAIHTNLDNIEQGVSWILGQKIGLIHSRVLVPKKGLLRKLVTFCPEENAESVRQALFNAGAGFVGNYDSCSFNAEGTGSFRGLEGSHPYVGEKGNLHFEHETRIETIFPSHREQAVIHALLDAHPYEEVAYDIYPLLNEYKRAGTGIIGELSPPLSEPEFFHLVKHATGSHIIRHSQLLGNIIKKVAVCGGSGSFLIKDAIARKADMFLTADLKYHDFFEADQKIVLMDVGHYESEQFTKELIVSILVKKIPNFVVLLTEHNTNAVHYF